MREPLGYNQGEYLRPREQQSMIDTERVDAYREYHELGPRVGNVEVMDRESGLPVRFDVHVRMADGYEQFLLSPMEGSEPSEYGRIWLRADTPGQGANRAELPIHHPEHQYGEGFGSSNPSKEFIVMTNTNGRNHEFRGLGHSLSRIAIERSFQIGAEGRVQGQAAYYSFGAWEAWGFRGQPIYDESGNIVHPGDRWHKQLEAARRRHTHITSWRPSEEQEKILRQSLDLQKEDQAYFYLPDDSIEKERQRIQIRPILDVNGPTINALVEKHKRLGNQRSALRSAKEELMRFGPNWQEKVSGNEYEFKKIAEDFMQGGDREHAHDIFEKVIASYEAEMNNETRPTSREMYTSRIARLYSTMGELQKAYDYWMQAAQSAEKRKDDEAALDYYTSAPYPPKVGEMLERLHGIAYREW